MAIPEFSMISDFEAGVKCLQNPSMISRFFPLSGMEMMPQVYNFWKWGAVILAILATFSSIIKRVKLLLIRLGSVKPSVGPLLQQFVDDFDFSDEDDDEGDECSSVSSSMEDNDTRDFEQTTAYRDDFQWGFDQDFRVAGGDFYATERWQNGDLRLRRRQSGNQRFSWSDFSTGKSVVKLWDSLGLGLDFEDSGKNVVSMWDLDKNQKIMDIFGGCSKLPAVEGVAVPSMKVVLSAEVNCDRNGVVLGAYDTRMSPRKAAVCAEWGPPAAGAAGKVVEMGADGVEKVYVRDDVTGVLTVGDLRNYKAPLKTVKVTESDGDTWWDADAVIVED